MIDPTTAQKIKDTADIVEVVSDYVHLVRRGANFMGLCPFHNERTPSFSVNKNRNFCYCFSCHKGGSPVNFIMEKEGISYYDALRHLAKKYGIEIRETELTDEQRLEQSRREGMFVANEWAKNYFRDNLENKQEGQTIGLSYLFGRKITKEAISAFQLGYAIDRSNDFTEAALRKGFSLELLKTLGLTGTSQQGINYDKLRGRVIFPFINTSGKIVGFGGRDLKGSPAKYINSPESEIYVKSNELYGLYQARNSINREDKCYLVEGYFDVIGMWQSGIQNVVASSGTSLTDGQIALIHRFTQNVTLIYDGDSAGIKASLRGIDMLLAHNLNVKAVPLPAGDDPDSLAAKLSPEELKEYLSNNEVDIIRFKSRILLEDAKDDPQKRWQASQSIIESISNIPDKIKRDIYIQECSKILDIPESSLRSATANLRSKIIERERLRKRQEEQKERFPENDPRWGDGSKHEVAKQHMESSPLFPLEKQLIINCLKYGFLKIWDDDLDPQAGMFQTVFEYIDEELSIDNITFSHPDYFKAFSVLKTLLTEFKKDHKEFKLSLDVKKEQLLKEGYDSIALQNSSMTELEREENKLRIHLNDWAENENKEFCRSYILDKLGSHEDPVIRSLTLEAYAEKHQLSNIFVKLKDQEMQSETIFPVIISSLNVLKNGIIDLQLQKLMTEMRNLTDASPEKVNELHSQISAIMQLRAKMAKNIGERIVCPKK